MRFCDKNNSTMIKRFFLYGIIGWSMEIVWTGFYSLLSGHMALEAYTSLWMFFIYGSAVFLEPLHDIIRNWNLVLRGIIWVVIIWGIEYSTGKLLLELLHVYPWQYFGKFAVEGIVRLDYAPAWFVAGLLFERMHGILDRLRIN
ncbi:putative ABC transporter type IV [Ruminiclostridium sufflavum DSM 19573]|uniref:Putative ABC transporter type IV n=2 Tax=Ruminiclostridium TaxID=1508657 RepID=A0A318Y4E8_9FIRM|nr:putative ABC transporter type IV [Ruminiclostridium sufflavum DSM 19573]